MNFDGTIHLGDLLIAAGMVGGGLLFMVRVGGFIGKLASTMDLIQAKLHEHEKRLDKHDDLIERRSLLRTE